MWRQRVMGNGSVWVAWGRKVTWAENGGQEKWITDKLRQERRGKWRQQHSVMAHQPPASVFYCSPPQSSELLKFSSHPTPPPPHHFTILHNYNSIWGCKNLTITPSEKRNEMKKVLWNMHMIILAHVQNCRGSCVEDLAQSGRNFIKVQVKHSYFSTLRWSHWGFPSEPETRKEKKQRKRKNKIKITSNKKRKTKNEKQHPQCKT